MIKKLTFFLFLMILITGCSAGGSDVIFSAPAQLPNALVDQSYDGKFSFCKPDLKSANELCDGTNPSYGDAPYHFTLDSGTGFLPIGMKLELNGLVTGAPSSSGKSIFTVCAVDVSGDQNCKETSITVRDSAQLTVRKEGTGTGTVTNNKGFDCGDKCTENYAIGESVNLNYKADEGSIFQKWGDKCEGLLSCNFKISEDTEVTATFSKFDLELVSASCRHIGQSSSGLNEYRVELSGTAAGPETSSIKFYNNLNVIFPEKHDCGSWERCRSNGEPISWSKIYTFNANKKPFNYQPRVALLDTFDSVSRNIDLVCE